MHSAREFDIVILGAGPVGTTLALLLAGSRHRVLLVEQRALSAGLKDPRALALSEGARQLLDPQGAWPNTTGIGDGRCTPIETIHISQTGGFGRTLIDRQDYQIAALGYVVRYGALMDGLQQALGKAQQRHHEQLVCFDNTSARVIDPDRQNPQAHDFWRDVELSTAEKTYTVRTRLIVHAEGTPPDDSQGVIARGYGQRAIIFEAGLAQSHGQRAWERFTPQGPLALLPVDGAGGNRVSVVYTVAEQEAETLLGCHDAAILQRIQQAIGPLATFTDIGPRASFPLKLRLRQPAIAQRELWIGNAAQTLHPVSGQGFNLGLRDAAMLAQALRLTLDPGSAPVLERYGRSRQMDRWGAAGFTDSIVRTFSTPLPMLTSVRGIALSALDLIGPLRHFVARRMIWGARAWP
ncbi:MAG: 2-octaprenyl-6-methoxyphenyl hydroxylase [Rhodocyclaceae bacterium]|nr:2-octaprenyl-6-methoxyphenyl hydroxylase [Rhodocyclaceae bacterium]